MWPWSSPARDRSPGLENAVTPTSNPADAAAVDHRDPEVRLRALFDQGSLRLLAPRDDSGVLAARGEGGGPPVVAVASAPARRGPRSPRRRPAGGAPGASRAAATSWTPSTRRYASGYRCSGCGTAAG